ncbi:hypothetical protein CONPUDRAFT_61286, partial [Coniophora puteana RWD-64-598 SS2]
MLPPADDDVGNSICVLFTGASARVTRDTLLHFKPLLASKSIVRTLISFLVENNPFYREADVQFSEENLNNLFYPEHASLERAPLRAMQVCTLEGHDNVINAETFTSSHVTSAADADYYRDGDFVLPSVGYTAGERSVGSREEMKHIALTHVLNRNRFIWARSGSSFLSEDDPCFLSSLFPHLDMFGIGAFNHPARLPSQKISIKAQTENMLRRHQSKFVGDPVFPFIMWNVVQKRNVRQNSSFTVPESTQMVIQRELLEVAPALVDLAAKWKKDPRASPVTHLERKAVQLLRQVQFTSTNIPGSPGYKLARRNEVRAMLPMYGTPALF